MNYVQTLIEQIMMMFLIIGIGVFLEKKKNNIYIIGGLVIIVIVAIYWLILLNK